MDIDLSNYVRIGRYDLPEPTRTVAPANNLLAQEVSAVTYNWDTDSLFVVGDGGTSITQISKTGQLIDTMTLAQGSSPQGTEFYDPEGLTYIGNGQFVMTEERDRSAVLVTYQAGTTLTRTNAPTVSLGTNVGNVGIEGLSYDPLTGGYIFAKEKTPISVFQSTIDFVNGTASNGSASTVNNVDLFDSTGLNVLDLADVYALSNISAAVGADEEANLLLLSQESAQVLEVDRAGNILSTLTLVSDPGNPLDIASQQHEGMTMDANGYLYIVSENGGGDFDHPQLWVYAPSITPNAAPSAITLGNSLAMIDENTSTVARIKVADVVLTDDGQGTNALGVSGADAAFFEVDSTGLYIKAGVVLDYESKTSYAVTVEVDDASLGATPDASANYVLSLNDIVVENVAPVVYISEVAPWSSGNSPVGADWFEVTNGGSSVLDITGWRVDDGSASFASSAALSGVTSIAAGQSAIFLEGGATQIANFITTWFGGVQPANVQIGSYSGSGLGLSTSGDGVNLFDATGTNKASVSFGASPASAPFATFNNAAGLNNATLTTLSAVGQNGAVTAPGNAAEIGSPGSVGRLIISEVAPWSSGSSPVAADWFEVTNTSAFAIDISGWKMDDSSGSPAAAVALNGITTIGAGESVIFIESANPAAAKAAFLSIWFGGNAPASLQIGSYTGGGVGLGTGGDAVNLYDNTNALRASVAFGASPAGPAFATFDNAAGLNGTTLSTLSVTGANAAFDAVNHTTETGSPGEIAVVNDAPVAQDDVLADIAEDTPSFAISFASLIANDMAGPANETTQTLTITSVGNAVGGTVSIVGTDVIFTPDANFHGSARFDYSVLDNGTSYGRNAFLSDTGTASFTVTSVNDAPVFTSPTSFVVNENAVAAASLAAADTENDALTYSISGGADQSLFAIDQNSGAVSFVSAPDYETPGDADQNNVYALDVTVTDALGDFSVQSITISVSDIAEAGLTINGTRGADALNGTTGNDIINAGNGNDTVSGGDGNDTILAGNGNDTVSGGRGTDLLSGENGADILDGGAGDDLLFGGIGNDQLNSGDGADSLFGENGIDYLSGGLGDDILDGGLGKDYLTGGEGADSFLLGLPALSGADSVQDFVSGLDKIQLNGADFGLAAGALDSSMLVYGTRATDNHAEFIYNTATGRLLWDADGIGGARAVTIGFFENHAAITVDDFLLV
ncbi:MAG: SdiA-regulated domain-containing protein [Sphingobium sp.]|nr:SdiA-regulated domain-containing protein [Sphingobium sp.]MBP8671544.1 SdiA-regulated domain-containing protein [Sphingobium sp.]MBP9157316.1 SdiA-regulated domain-containing protein [Sphingobium sp.]MCC6482535.1 SdiA-regulated domain-containing protein [Sphingomonadaceae bacterium]